MVALHSSLLWKSMATVNCLVILTFFKISSFVLNGRNKLVLESESADDTQIYLALSPNDYSPIDSLCQCIDEINSWMCQNFLQLNKEKTEVIAFGNNYEVLKVNGIPWL